MAYKYLFAWLLLLTISIQWIGGVVFVKLTQSAWIEFEMNESEAQLAEMVKADHGIQASVRILDEEEQVSILKMGYGTPFLFSTAGEDGVQYFTIDAGQDRLVHYEYLINGNTSHEDDGKALVSLNKLFSPYIINRAFPARSLDNFRVRTGNFAYQGLDDLFFNTIPTPPPARVG